MTTNTKLTTVPPVDQSSWKDKGERISQDVLDVLRTSTITAAHLELPPGQLERKRYLKVDKVLTRLRGTWDKKQKGHLFAEDPRPLFALVFEIGTMPPKNPTAYYPTPDEVADLLLTSEALADYRIPKNATKILEPSAGTGNLARAVRAYCVREGIISPTGQLDCCEIVPAFVERLREQAFPVVGTDFLAFKPAWGYHAMVMNPPFSVDGDACAYATHILHAWDLLAPGGVILALAPEGIEFRKHTALKPLQDLIKNHGGSVSLPAGAFKKSGTGVKTRMIGLRKPLHARGPQETRREDALSPSLPLKTNGKYTEGQKCALSLEFPGGRGPQWVPAVIVDPCLSHPAVKISQQKIKVAYLFESTDWGGKPFKRVTAGVFLSKEIESRTENAPIDQEDWKSV